MSIAKDSYIVVASNQQLSAVCARMASATRIAVDTEFVGEKYFYARLEVLQLSDGNEIALVDAQAITDWSSLATLLSDQNRLKLFHAAGQDIEILQRTLGIDPTPIFDTQVAASFLGYGAQVSHANLVKAVVGEDVSGKQTTSDWSHRPLGEEQLQYAANDVRYLHQIHETLANELVAKGRLHWFEDDQAAKAQETLNPEHLEEDLLYRRVKDWSSLNGREMAILRELARWRDREARSRDVPRKAVLTDDGMIELARFQPATKDKALKLRRINGGQIARSFKDILACIEIGKAVPRDQMPRKAASERPDIPTGLLELCQGLLRTQAENNQVAPTVLATTSDLQALITERQNPEKLDIPLLKGWRRDIAGQHLLDLLQGRTQVIVAQDGSLQFEPRVR